VRHVPAARERSVLAAMVAATIVSYPLGLWLGGKWLLPLLNTIPAYAAMVVLLRRGRRGRAVAAMLAWAVTLAVVGTLFLRFWPQAPDALVFNGPRYRDEMFHWIRSGEGSEGSLRLFLPQHLLHLVAFVALCLATASAAAIFMGALLMNYMDFYVASLSRAGVTGWAATLLGWQPWAICRVAAFCILGVVLAEPLLSKVLRYPYEGLRAARPWIMIAAAGILADWVLKAALAPAWGRWLRALLPAAGR
jgi:hypothetical protein